MCVVPFRHLHAYYQLLGYICIHYVFICDHNVSPIRLRPIHILANLIGNSTDKGAESRGTRVYRTFMYCLCRTDIADIPLPMATVNIDVKQEKIYLQFYLAIAALY